jgi:hypothetical protein
MTTTTLTRSLLLLGVFALVGCFSPSYGDTPFWCTADEPYCPDGFTCATDSPAPDPANPDHRLCVKPAGGGNNGGKCLDDDIEQPVPNDSPQTATSLDGSLQSHPQGVSLYGVEICTAEDVDYYSFTLPGEKAVTVYVQYSRDQGELTANLLDENLDVAAQGAPVGGGLQMSATVPAGLYYVQVAAGPGGSTNQYDFSLTIATP